jgi:hypothetical protein
VAVATQRPSQVVAHFWLHSTSWSSFLQCRSHLSLQLCEHDALQRSSPLVAHESLQSPAHSLRQSPCDDSRVTEHSVSQLVWHSRVHSVLAVAVQVLSHSVESVAMQLCSTVVVSQVVSHSSFGTYAHWASPVRKMPPQLSSAAFAGGENERASANVAPDKSGKILSCMGESPLPDAPSARRAARRLHATYQSTAERLHGAATGRASQRMRARIARFGAGRHATFETR